MMINNITNINKTNNHLCIAFFNLHLRKDILTNDDQQYHQYQQNKQSPLT
jgi:hypothetical protein